MTSFEKENIPFWVSLCSQLAPLVSSGVFLAPFPTIQKFSKSGTGSLPLLPYSSMCINGFAWFTYGILKNQATVWRPNLFGLCCGIYYFYQFTRFCDPKAKELPGTVSEHVRYSSLLATLIVLISLTAPDPEDLIGKLGVLFCIILFASPLSTLRTVIATRNANCIPLPFTLACLINCGLWSISGLFDMHDFNIYFPNVLGLIFSVLQVLLILFYGRRVEQKESLPL